MSYQIRFEKIVIFLTIMVIKSYCSIKAHAKGRNKSQHFCVLLEDFGKQCCVSLHGPKSLTGFKLYATSTNIVVVPCKRTKHVGSNNLACG